MYLSPEIGGFSSGSSTANLQDLAFPHLFLVLSYIPVLSSIAWHPKGLSSLFPRSISCCCDRGFFMYSFPVFHQHVKNMFLGEVIQNHTSIKHCAKVAIVRIHGIWPDPLILEINHWLDPQAWVRALWTGLNRTILYRSIVHGVGEHSSLCIKVSVVSGWPRTVIFKIILSQHLKHAITPSLQEWSSVSRDFTRWNRCKLANHFSHSNHFILPSFCIQLFPVILVLSMSNRVGSHLMTKMPVSVNQRVIRVRLGYEMCSTDCTFIGIFVRPIKHVAVELFLGKSCESIIECQVYNHGALVNRDACFIPAAVAFFSETGACIRVTFFCRTIREDEGENRG